MGGDIINPPPNGTHLELDTRATDDTDEAAFLGEDARGRSIQRWRSTVQPKGGIKPEGARPPASRPPHRLLC